MKFKENKLIGGGGNSLKPSHNHGLRLFLRCLAAFTLAEGATHVAHWNNSRKIAFTLAEVLITLGIIGVVAALTLPTLIENHNKRVVETRLQKFYSAMNQAIKMAELDYGDRDTWFEDNTAYSGKQKIWVDKYLVPYLKVAKTDKLRTGGGEVYAIYFADGSAVSMVPTNGRDWWFFSSNPEKCIADNDYSYRKFMGKCAFAFYYNPTRDEDGKINNAGWNFNPFGYGWDGYSENYLKNDPTYGCYPSSSWHGHCTALIQYNNWKFPKDYPFKVRYR